MNVKKWLAGAVAVSMLTGAVALAVAAPASASDEGSQLPGGIYWFDTVGPLSAQSAATQITSGVNATNGGNLGTGRPWATLTTENACPATTTQMGSYIRIPQVGVPENDWEQVQVGAAATLQEDGRFYTTTVQGADRLAKPQVLTYNAAHGGTGTYPFITVCRTAAGASLGYFATTITFTGTAAADLSWSIVSPAYTGGGGPVAAATTTTLAAAAAGADLVLTATVSPAAAAGTVTFKEGATTLGSAAVAGGTAQFTVTAPAQGAHTYTASFAPTDAAAYEASSGSIGLVIGIDSATGQITVTVPAAPVVDGALTFAVPFNTPVGLLGTRTGDNSRVTASAPFPRVTVTDTRRDALLTGWEVNVQASDFVGATTIGAKYLGWAPAAPSMTPESGSPLMTQAGSTIASFMDDSASAGLGTSAILGRTTVPGRGVTTLDATLNLAIPGSTPEGDYTSTVTVTLVAD